MDSLNLLLEGFATAIQPAYLLYAFLGVLLGTAVGVLPGIGPAMAVALLLPLTYTLDVTSAIIMFAGIYYGGMYGGSTTSILLNTPGESSSIVTAMEGNKMARAGRAAAALATAAIGSFVAGTLATVGLTFFAPGIAQFAKTFGPADYFALMIVAFLTIGALLGGSPVRGMVSLAVGLFLGLVGTDTLTGQARFTFGIPNLGDGIDVVIIAVGLFAVGEALHIGSRLRHSTPPVRPVSGSWRSWMSKSDWKRSWKPWLRGTAIGFPIGSIPAGGADVATFLSYATEKKLTREPYRQQFGKGAIEGVAGPEAANNAAAAGVLVPLLTLGIPTTATAAVIISAFTTYGIQPGPLLFENQSALVWALIASLYIGNVVLVVLNLPLVGLWAKVLQIPRPYLYAGILVFAGLGAYAANFQVFDIAVLLLLGVIGFFMRRHGYPVAPMVVGGILGPMAEEQLRKAMAISQGDPSILVRSPVSIVIYVALALLLIGGFWLRRRQARFEAAIPDVDTTTIRAVDAEIARQLGRD
ncbi:tripartite tricarboxylate transporter permease [Microbacterium sp. Root53]|jgi:putative tricarboxylic transport membrane protein|uniref:tripartite tricarboxylate transporter permease n=1 Tax=Microbacterium sp. Root53 TaxID=1736553 RepID=UPI0006F4F393|nr:tripartite tricarboxylate transporter permease [Microbacterium sp. Root53]KQZ07281.1 tripartite tricarboxylate transporter TctA [Microbacterium sp. Root53]